jgi:hypothetical protein
LKNAKPTHHDANRTLANAIFWLVRKAIAGFGPFSSAEELAKQHLQTHKNPEKAIDSLIRAEVLKVGTAGFLVGLPGFLAMPFTLPAGMGADYFLAARVVAAIAKLRGWDLHNPKVQMAVLLCVLGHHGKETLKNISKAAGIKAAQGIIGTAGIRTAMHLEHKVGSKLMARMVKGGASKIAKAVPLAGGILGAGIDASYLMLTAKAAREFFPAHFERNRQK